MRLLPSRQTLDRADLDCVGFRKLTNVLLGNLQISGVVNLGVRGDVEDHAPGEAFVEKFQCVRRAMIGFSGQNDDEIRAKWSVDFEDSAGIPGENDRSE